MAKDEKKSVFIDDVEYKIDDLSEEQIAMLNHIQDLDRKLGNARFNLDQLQVGRDSFFAMLKGSLGEVEKAA